MSMEEEGHLIWLKNELSQIKDTFNRYSKLGNLLKEELTRLGHWKARGRGNPRKGWKNSKIAQKQAEIKKIMKER